MRGCKKEDEVDMYRLVRGRERERERVEMGDREMFVVVVVVKRELYIERIAFIRENVLEIRSEMKVEKVRTLK